MRQNRQLSDMVRHALEREDGDGGGISDPRREPPLQQRTGERGTEHAGRLEAQNVARKRGAPEARILHDRELVSARFAPSGPHGRRPAHRAWHRRARASARHPDRARGGSPKAHLQAPRPAWPRRADVGSHAASLWARAAAMRARTFV
jgi:hypothetical protein